MQREAVVMWVQETSGEERQMNSKVRKQMWNRGTEIWERRMKSTHSLQVVHRIVALAGRVWTSQRCHIVLQWQTIYIWMWNIFWRHLELILEFIYMRDYPCQSKWPRSEWKREWHTGRLCSLNAAKEILFGANKEIRTMWKHSIGCRPFLPQKCVAKVSRFGISRYINQRMDA